MPNVARIGQQVMHLIGFMVAKLKLFESDRNPTRLRSARVQVDDHQNLVREIFRNFTVGNQLLVVDQVKPQAPIAMQRWTRLPNRIYARYQLLPPLCISAVPTSN